VHHIAAQLAVEVIPAALVEKTAAALVETTAAALVESPKENVLLVTDAGNAIALVKEMVCKLHSRSRVRRTSAHLLVVQQDLVRVRAQVAQTRRGPRHGRSPK